MMVALADASKDDAGAIGAILSAWIDEVDWMVRVHAPSEYPGYGELLVVSAEVTVARHNGQVVGFLARQAGDIQALYIKPRHRGLGIGVQLLELAKSATSRLGLWTFQANAAARRFYGREGFVEDELTDGRNNDEKLPDVHMIWQGGLNG